MFKKSKHGSRVSRSRTTDMTSWDLGPHEEDLDKSQFSKMASGESFYYVNMFSFYDQLLLG